MIEYYYKINHLELNTEINFLKDRALEMGTDRFLYRYSAEYGEKAAFAALQAELQAKAAEKVPEMAAAGAFFTRRSLEQCSAEQVAAYKAAQFGGGRILILAGGLGADDIAFSRVFKQVISLDPDAELNRIARYNFECMGIQNIQRLDMSAEAFLADNQEDFDLVYADPDRRDGEQRQILLKDHRPDITALSEDLFRICPEIAVKCSPLYDHEMASRELPGLKHIYSISRNGEMKEMLLLAGAQGDGKPAITCCDIRSDKRIAEYHSGPGEDALPEICTALPGYLFEAGASLVKVRRHHAYARRHSLRMLDKGHAFYAAEDCRADLLGRCLKVIHAMPFTASSCIEYLRLAGIQKANVKVRGLAFNTAGLMKKIKLKEGGEDYLFVIPGMGTTLFLHCRYQALTVLM